MAFADVKKKLSGFKVSPQAFWRWADVLPVILLVGSSLLVLRTPAVIEDFQNRVFDNFLRIRPRPYNPDAPVRIIDISDKSLDMVGQWPWPRTKLAKLVRRLSESGVGVIVFDIVYSERDRTSPALIAEELPKTDEFRFFRDRLKTLPDHDKIFSEAIAGASVVVGVPLTATPNEAKPERKAIVVTKNRTGGADINTQAQDLQVRKGGSFEVEEVKATDFMNEYSGAVVNLKAIEDAAGGVGIFGVFPDRDGVIRRVPLIFNLRNKIYPSLALEAMRLAVGVRMVKVTVAGSGSVDWGESAGIQDVALGPIPMPDGTTGDLSIPTNGQGEIILFDTDHQPGRYIEAYHLMDDGAYEKFDASPLAGSIAFVGTSAAGLKDLRTTPLRQNLPGVEVHAQVAEQILLKEFLTRPVWGYLIEFGLLLLLGIAVLYLTSKFGALISAVVGIAGVGSAYWVSWRLFVDKKFLLDPVTPSLSVLLVYISATVINYLRSESEKKHIHQAFGRYMSPDLVDQLAEDSSKLELGGEIRPMTLMFSDIRGFTTISEQFDAKGLTQFINAYLTPMTNIVLEHKGTIDKYMGDCIMAFWNAPLDDEKHAENACRSALHMRKRLFELNEQWAREAEEEGRKYIPIHTGIGLNSGDCCVGNMGSDLRQEYSVLGDDVNLASRLEGQSKSYGVEIVIGDNTRRLIPGFAYVELDLIKVKGKTVPVHIFTLLGDEEMARTDGFKKLAQTHAKMISAYRSQKWDECESLIDELRYMDFPLETLYDLYQARVEACRKNPPPEDWDGVFTATTK